MTATKKWFVYSVRTCKGSDDRVPSAPWLADGLTKGLKMDGYGFSAHTATAKPQLVSSLHYPLLGYPSPFLLMGPAARNLHLQCSLLVCVKWESGNCNKYDCIHLKKITHLIKFYLANMAGPHRTLSINETIIWLKSWPKQVDITIMQATRQLVQ